MNLEHAVDAAARSQWEAWTTAAYPVVPVRRWDHLSDTERDELRALVRPVVEAAAPHVAQDTLRDAANDLAMRLHGPGVNWGTRTNDVGILLTRADEIQAVTR